MYITVLQRSCLILHSAINQKRRLFGNLLFKKYKYEQCYLEKKKNVIELFLFKILVETKGSYTPNVLCKNKRKFNILWIWIWCVKYINTEGVAFLQKNSSSKKGLSRKEKKKKSWADDELALIFQMKRRKKRGFWFIQFSREHSSRESIMVWSRSGSGITAAFVHFRMSVGQFEVLLAELESHMRKYRNHFREPR